MGPRRSPARFRLRNAPSAVRSRRARALAVELEKARPRPFEPGPRSCWLSKVATSRTRIHAELRDPEVRIGLHGPHEVLQARVEHRRWRELELRLPTAAREVDGAQEAERFPVQEIRERIGADVDMTAWLAEDPHVDVIDADLARRERGLVIRRGVAVHDAPAGAGVLDEYVRALCGAVHEDPVPVAAAAGIGLVCWVADDVEIESQLGARRDWVGAGRGRGDR